MEHILNWPIPKSATHVRQFLGLVWYISTFLPKIAEYTTVLNELTHKNCEKKFPAWTDRYQRAFNAIKNAVVSRECLTTIDLKKLPSHQIFVSTDASDVCSGAVLLFGETWESSWLVAFDSMTFKGAELDYPVHEEELLAIIHASKKMANRSDWCAIYHLHRPQDVGKFSCSTRSLLPPSKVDGVFIPVWWKDCIY